MRTSRYSASNKGYSLVQTLVVTALASVVSLGLASVLKENHSQLRRNSAELSRLMVINTIRFNSGNFISVNKSSFENAKEGFSELRNCVCGHSTCEANINYPMSLFDSGGKKVAGSKSSPLFYNTRGQLCDPKQEDCILEATTQFICIGTNCGKTNAMSESDPILRISYSIKPISPERVRAFGRMPEITGPEIDITATSIRDYSINNNLCVQVLSISPNQGPLKGGNDIEVQGSGLTSVLDVSIAGEPCSINSKTGSKLSCTVPESNSLGPKNVLVEYGKPANPEKILLLAAYTYKDGATGPNEPPQECPWYPSNSPPPDEVRDIPYLPSCTIENNHEMVLFNGAPYECRC